MEGRRFRNFSSRSAQTSARGGGYAVANIDASLILAAPKIGPHATSIRARVAELLGIPVDCVGLKAKTPEGLNLDNAAIAHVVVLLEKSARPSRKKEINNNLRLFSPLPLRTARLLVSCAAKRRPHDHLAPI